MNCIINSFLAVFLCVFLPSTIQGQTCACSGCPNGWMTYEKSCYLFLDNLEYTWDEASHFCGLEGAHLVYIESANENKFIKDHSFRLYKTASERHTNGATFWIGGTDHTIEGIWQWSRLHGNFNFTDWGPSQPDEGISANCATLWGIFEFQWADRPCKLRYHFICEKRETVDQGNEIIG